MSSWVKDLMIAQSSGTTAGEQAENSFLESLVDKNDVRTITTIGDAVGEVAKTKHEYVEACGYHTLTDKDGNEVVQSKADAQALEAWNEVLTSLAVKAKKIGSARN